MFTLSMKCTPIVCYAKCSAVQNAVDQSIFYLVIYSKAPFPCGIVLMCIHVCTYVQLRP